MSSPGGSDADSVPTPPEEVVRTLRAALRRRESLQAEGRHSEAERRQAESDALLEDLLHRLMARFRYYARRRLSDPQLVEDAVMEMGLTLCRRLPDTTGRHYYFEVRFNAAIVTLCLDAIKKVRRENGLDAQGRPATAGYRLVSLDSGSGGEDDDPGALGERIGDPEATRVLSERLGEVLTAQYLRRLPTGKHARVVADRWNHRDWEETASRAGVSLRTARNYYDRAIECLRETVRPEEWPEEWEER